MKDEKTQDLNKSKGFTFKNFKILTILKKAFFLVICRLGRRNESRILLPLDKFEIPRS